MSRGRLARVEDRRPRGWFWADNNVLTDNGASAMAKFTYITLGRFADASGKCWPLIDTLAKAMSLSRSSVKRALTELATELDPPRIQVIEGGGRGESNLYVILPWPKPEDGNQVTENRFPQDGSLRPNLQDVADSASTAEGGEDLKPVPTEPASEPKPVHREPGAVHTDPGGGSHRPIEGIPTEGIPKKELLLPPPARAGAAVVESIEIDGLEPGPEGGRWRWPDPHTLVAMYNAFTPDNVSAVVSFAGARVDATRRMLRLFPKLEWWLEVFRQYHRSKFLSGLTRPTQGHEAFTPDFDWLMARGKDRIENAVKVHDGRYLR